MSNISRGAGERIAKAVQKIERLELPPAQAKPPNNLPIILMRAQEAIAQGATGPAKRLARPEYVRHAKGAEQEIGDNVQVYNRWGDIDEGDDFLARWVDGGYEVLQSRRGPADASPCGVCSRIGGASLTVPVTGDVDAYAAYTFSPLCDGSLYLTFNWDSSLTWLGTADSMLLDCGGEAPRTLTATMTATGIDPGDLTIVLNDGTLDVATYKNHAAWQPCVPIRMRLEGYDTTCPCAPWDPWCCLTPIVPE